MLRFPRASPEPRTPPRVVGTLHKEFPMDAPIATSAAGVGFCFGSRAAGDGTTATTQHAADAVADSFPTRIHR